MMDCREAQDIAFRLVNLKSDKVTLGEIKHALIILANWYEDNRSMTDNRKECVKILKSSTWQSMNDKLIVQRVIEILEGK